MNHSKAEMDNLHNQFEDLQPKFDKVDQYRKLESDLRTQLENTKLALEKEKKDRVT